MPDQRVDVQEFMCERCGSIVPPERHQYDCPNSANEGGEDPARVHPDDVDSQGFVLHPDDLAPTAEADRRRREVVHVGAATVDVTGLSDSEAREAIGDTIATSAVCAVCGRPAYNGRHLADDSLLCDLTPREVKVVATAAEAEDIAAHEQGEHDEESVPGCPRCEDLYDEDEPPPGRDYVFNHRSATATLDLSGAARDGVLPAEAIPSILRTSLAGSGWALVGVTSVDPSPEEGSYRALVGFHVRESDEPRIHALSQPWLEWQAEMTEEASLSIRNAIGLSWAEDDCATDITKEVRS